MNVKIVSGIPGYQEKHLIKLRPQQEIINTRLANNTQDRMPLTSTNPSIYIQHYGFPFIRRQMAVSPQAFEHFQ